MIIVNNMVETPFRRVGTRKYAFSESYGPEGLDDSISERLDSMLREHKELRRMTSAFNESFHDNPHQPTLEVPATYHHGEPFETWAMRKDQERKRIQSKEANRRDQMERQRLEEDELKVRLEEEASRKREISLKKFMQRVQEYEDQKRQKELSIQKSEDIKRRLHDIRRSRGEAAYDAWLATHEHVSRTQDHTSSRTPCKPSSLHKSLSFDEWRASLEVRPSPPPFFNPHPWIDPEPTAQDEFDDAVSHIQHRQVLSASSKVRHAPREEGVIGVRPSLSSHGRSPARPRSSRATQSAPPSAPESPLAYQDPSPPLLWRDRDLLEKARRTT